MMKIRNKVLTRIKDSALAMCLVASAAEAGPADTAAKAMAKAAGQRAGIAAQVARTNAVNAERARTAYALHTQHVRVASAKATQFASVERAKATLAGKTAARAAAHRTSMPAGVPVNDNAARTAFAQRKEQLRVANARAGHVASFAHIKAQLAAKAAAARAVTRGFSHTSSTHIGRIANDNVKPGRALVKIKAGQISQQPHNGLRGTVGSTLAANQWVGKVGPSNARYLGPEVRVQTGRGPRGVRVSDHVFVDAKSRLYAMEVKVGQSPYKLGQRAKDLKMATVGGTILGGPQVPKSLIGKRVRMRTSLWRFLGL